jgi:hypothetical protein
MPFSGAPLPRLIQPDIPAPDVTGADIFPDDCTIWLRHPRQFSQPTFAAIGKRVGRVNRCVRVQATRGQQKEEAKGDSS